MKAQGSKQSRKWVPLPLRGIKHNWGGGGEHPLPCSLPCILLSLWKVTWSKERAGEAGEDLSMDQALLRAPQGFETLLIYGIKLGAQGL
jgi:hypothetical protein